MITSITKVLLTGAIKAARTLDSAGARCYARLDTLAWAPAVLWKLCAYVRSTGAALEAFAEGAAPRLGIDMVADVLEPMIDRAYRA